MLDAGFLEISHTFLHRNLICSRNICFSSNAAVRVVGPDSNLGCVFSGNLLSNSAYLTGFFVCRIELLHVNHLKLACNKHLTHDSCHHYHYYLTSLSLHFIVSKVRLIIISKGDLRIKWHSICIYNIQFAHALTPSSATSLTNLLIV